MKVEDIAGINGDTEIVVISPYKNEPNDIHVENVRLSKDGKLKIVPDHEFTIVPIEWYGAHVWYERQSNRIVNELAKILMSKTIDKEDILSRIGFLVQSFYDKTDTSVDIPERTALE